MLYYIELYYICIIRCSRDTTSAGFIFTAVVCICYKQLYEDEVSEAGPESWFYMRDDYTLITTLTSKTYILFSLVNCSQINIVL